MTLDISLVNGNYQQRRISNANASRLIGVSCNLKLTAALPEIKNACKSKAFNRIALYIQGPLSLTYSNTVL